MTLEDFEKSLAEEKIICEENELDVGLEKNKKRRKHHHRDHANDHDQSHGKRSRHSRKDENKHRRTFSSEAEKKAPTSRHDGIQEEEEWVEKEANLLNPNKSIDSSMIMPPTELKRDSWMESASSLGIDFVQRPSIQHTEPITSCSARADFELKIHANELNKHHLQDLADGKETSSDFADRSTDHVPDYAFGDEGARWRMTKLKAIFKRAEETQKPVEEVAMEQFDSLRAFDEAREEEIELERRETYGKGYVMKEKPSGDLYQERRLNTDVQSGGAIPAGGEQLSECKASNPKGVGPSHETSVPIDQTTLNRLKACMMKAKLRGSSDASSLEQEYAKAIARFENRQETEVIILGAMENRMLLGRKGELKDVDSKRGRERGLVEDNEDMSIEDMVREERRTRNQAGGDSQRFAEQIARDGKFDNNLEYLNENANKLAKRMQKSEINLKNSAVSDFQKMNRILDNCPLCHQEDKSIPPVAPVISLATRVYLTLPTEPEISDGGAIIVPIQHRGNLLECDDDEWEEIRNFMKSLTRMYHDQGRDVLFYENAAAPQRKKHAGMEVVPLPYGLGGTAPAFFKEAILSSDEEWTQHKKIIDTLTKARQGQGKLAFRRSLVKEMPYFHVWFEINGGLGHVVEDYHLWPKGDLFAREIIGGMLETEPDIIRKQGRWNRGGDTRVDGFRKKWKKFDWTRVLTDG